MADKVIILKEGFWASIGKDAGSFVTAVSLTGFGRVVEIPALSWVGAILFFGLMLTLAVRLVSDNRRTIAEAREYLDEIEAANGR